MLCKAYHVETGQLHVLAMWYHNSQAGLMMFLVSCDHEAECLAWTQWFQMISLLVTNASS